MLLIIPPHINIYTLSRHHMKIAKTWRLMDAVAIDFQEVKNCEKLFTLQWNSLL